MRWRKDAKVYVALPDGLGGTTRLNFHVLSENLIRHDQYGELFQLCAFDANSVQCFIPISAIKGDTKDIRPC